MLRLFCVWGSENPPLSFFFAVGNKWILGRVSLKEKRNLSHRNAIEVVGVCCAWNWCDFFALKSAALKRRKPLLQDLGHGNDLSLMLVRMALATQEMTLRQIHLTYTPFSLPQRYTWSWGKTVTSNQPRLTTSSISWRVLSVSTSWSGVPSSCKLQGCRNIGRSGWRSFISPAQSRNYFWGAFSQFSKIVSLAPEVL